MNKLTRLEIRELCATRIMQWVPAGPYWLERSGKLWYVEARRSGVKDEVCDLSVFDPIEFRAALDCLVEKMKQMGYFVHYDEGVCESTCHNRMSAGKKFKSGYFPPGPTGERKAIICACLMALGVINENGEINA